MFGALLIIYFLFFIFLTWRNRILGLALIAALLPSYLIRFQVFGLPMTALEGMILITILVWAAKGTRNKLFFVFCSFTRKNWQWSMAIGLFLIAATISIFISPNERAALGIWKSYFVEPVLLFIVLISTIKTRHDLNKIIWGLALGALPVAIFAVIQKFTGWLIPNPFWQAEATRRVTSFFGYPNAVALYLAPLIPLMIYLLIPLIKVCRLRTTDYGLLKISILILTAVCSLLSVVFCHSAGALVALATTAIIFGLLNKKTRWWALGLIILAAFLIPLSPLKEPFRQEILMADRSGTVRINMWAETIEMLKTQPILGAGLAGYQETVQPYHILNWAEIYLYPHNLFLNFWSETGLLGLIGFWWLILNLFELGFKNLFGNSKSPDFNKSLAMALIASIIIIIIHGLVDVPYFKNDLAVIFWLLIGMAVINAKLARKNQSC